MKTIVQKVRFNAGPKVLYEMYMDPQKHALATGAKAKLSRKTGGAFSAYDGYIKGKNLHLVPGAMIVQTWRSAHWKKGEADSILILAFEGSGRGGSLTMTHANIPDREARGIEKGWKDYYWTPWKKVLSRG